MGKKKTAAIILERNSFKPLAKILLVGDPIWTDEILSVNGNLQRFLILSGKRNLGRVWFDQSAVIMRIGKVEWLVKIVTHPTGRETEGHLDLIKVRRVQGTKKLDSILENQIRKGRSLLQDLFS
jgi:hypothetical protein